MTHPATLTVLEMLGVHTKTTPIKLLSRFNDFKSSSYKLSSQKRQQYSWTALGLRNWEEQHQATERGMAVLTCCCQGDKHTKQAVHSHGGRTRRQVVKRHLPFVSIRKNISTCWHLGKSFMRLNWNGISCTRKPGPMSGSATDMNRTTRKQALYKLLWEL